MTANRAQEVHEGPRYPARVWPKRSRGATIKFPRLERTSLHMPYQGSEGAGAKSKTNTTRSQNGNSSRAE
jgi:hypothetical protein